MSERKYGHDLKRLIQLTGTNIILVNEPRKDLDECLLPGNVRKRFEPSYANSDLSISRHFDRKMRF